MVYKFDIYSLTICFAQRDVHEVRSIASSMDKKKSINPFT